MGRNPKIRVHYNADATYLIRLAHAIEMDTGRPLAWREDMISRLQLLARAFLDAPEPEHLAKANERRGRRAS